MPRLRPLIIAMLISGGCADTIVQPSPCGGQSDFSEGAALFAQQCAPCHGDEGLGGANPGIQYELHHSDAQLVQVMLEGTETMPAVHISEAEASAIVDYMRCELFNH